MIYYFPAMVVTMVLCRLCTVSVPLANGAAGNCFANWKMAFIALLPLTLLAVFRWDVGVDSLYGNSYWAAYHYAALGINNLDFEAGFYGLLRLFSRQGVPFFWFLFTLGLLFMGCTGLAMSRGSVWTSWSILAFFLLAVYFDCYSSLRQSLAEAICLIGWAEMGYHPPSRRKDLRILLIFAGAGLFHSTAWMNIPIYILCKFRLSRAGLLKAMVVAVLATPLLQVVISLVMAMFKGGKYDFIGVGLINAAMTGVLAIICWYFYDDITETDENAYMYVNQALCIFILLLNSGAMYLPYRVFDMLKIGYVFIVPYLLKGIKGSRLRLLMQFCMALIFGLWFFNFFYLQDSYTANYQTVFQDWSYITHLP